MQRRPDIYLDLALIALRKIPHFLKDLDLQSYLSDDLRQAAAERQLEITGDALGQLRKVSPQVFQRVPEGDVLEGKG